ncbi:MULTISPECIES: sugar ABC transporter substrate-binding protein [Pseudomonas]|uniref:Monosaccharide ABC transporter substrate-binding protein, CUT2 family n=1 Tax=Pseudomonas syringae pv. syringae (strain B728a) TaxID=205918 RepID=Q4ZSG1_PSEU2|nr:MULTISPECIES: sugar ABC transporter substrate-binding protein [Pseudomonas]AAY37911.1 monosaccharide ABC transporter substrate-binding protein, CUT2 family [Pseudomonas syringae pv. syringae B728a]AKF46413.1 monosaccharide ABC transporter substrate-binding protein, CUT2 family [Pseudomonas syringae pv. syringae B301D]AVB26220.1 sugar ABC transporter substrate-binding protein [Pseudomonas syringae pv. syringae]EXL28708.1 (Methylthio)ribose ABC-type transport system, periplasmic substrate-bind
MPDAVPTPKTKRLHAIGRTLVLSLLATSLVATAYAEDSDVPSLAGKRIAISMTGTSHYFDIKAFQAQVDEVKRLGGTPITLDAGRNDKNLVNQLQTVVTQKPDAVIQTLGTLSVIDPWLKRISKAGIPLFTIDAPSQYSLNNTTSDNVATGKALAGQLIKDAGGQGNVLVFNGFYGVPVCAIRYDQLKLALKDHPQLKIIEPELRDVIPNTVQDAYSQVSALLNKYPKGSVSAIWAAWDIPQLGASKALIDAGRTEIKTYGVDGTPEVLELMRREDSPVGAVVAQQPALIGKTAVQNVARYLAGQHDLPKETQVPTLLTTAANLPDVQKLRGDN